MLGYRFGVGTFGRCPLPLVVEDTGLGHPLDTSHRQLDPGDPRVGLEHIPQFLHLPWGGPDQASRVLVQLDWLAAALADRIDRPGGLLRGNSNGDPGSFHGLLLTRPRLRCLAWAAVESAACPPSSCASSPRA